MATRTKIRAQVKRKEKKYSYGKEQEYTYRYKDMLFKKPLKSSVIYVTENGRTSKFGSAGALSPFIDQVYAFLKNHGIAGGLLAGGLKYNKETGAVINGRGDVLYWVAELEGLLPKASKRYVEGVQDHLGELIVKAINAGME